MSFPVFLLWFVFFDASIELDQDTIPNPAQSRLVTSDDGRTPED